MQDGYIDRVNPKTLASCVRRLRRSPRPLAPWATLWATLWAPSAAPSHPIVGQAAAARM